MTSHHTSDRILKRKKWCDVKYYNRNSYKRLGHNKSNNIKNASRFNAGNYEKNEDCYKEHNDFLNEIDNELSLLSLRKEILSAYLLSLEHPSNKPAFLNLLKKFWTPSFVHEVVSCYKNSLRFPSSKPFTLNFFKRNDFCKNLESNDCFYQFLKTMWLCDEKNQKKLFVMCEEELERCFPEALEHYGIPDDFRYSDITQKSSSKNLENFVFTHGDDYLTKIITAPKIPLTDWITTHRKSRHIVQVKKVAFRVGKECMIGEFTKHINNSNNYVAQNSGSGIKFCVYARGLEKGNFVVTRWDYEPLSIHFNKFNERGDFDINGHYCEKTRHSHIHYYDLKQRLFLTQNQSADVSPTPINSNTAKDERTYKSFEDMVADFEWQNYCVDEKAPSFLQDIYLKEYIENMCPIKIENDKLIYDKVERRLPSNNCAFMPNKLMTNSYNIKEQNKDNFKTAERQMGE